MQIEFDPGKDTINVKKHGVSPARAVSLFANLTSDRIDLRRDYAEERRIAHGDVDGRLFVCVYTERDGRRRIISLRKANSREVRRYG
ncbi:MAG: BrnT family toxin [Inquilinus limosus]|uniref:BrnT family toxin n=1 Tax=Inquilinus limosus TaxID=171674 RepID=A0A952FQK2_9PROT|nr:BrnT family toxin [Inquilinus limosus]